MLNMRNDCTLEMPWKFNIKKCLLEFCFEIQRYISIRLFGGKVVGVDNDNIRVCFDLKSE